jgi:hypothetical protein
LTSKLESRFWLVIILVILVIGQIRTNRTIDNNHNNAVAARALLLKNDNNIRKQMRIIEARIAAIRPPAASGR